MEDDDVKKDISNLPKHHEKTCSKCNKTIQPGEYYVESILTGKITCSECDEGVLISGDVFYSIDD